MIVEIKDQAMVLMHYYGVNAEIESHERTCRINSRYPLKDRLDLVHVITLYVYYHKIKGVDIAERLLTEIDIQCT